jgi:putative redox protein
MTVFTADLELQSGVTFAATSGSGHTILMDSTEVTGGGNAGARPLEMLLMGVGGCAGMVALSLLRRMGQDVTAYRLRLEGDRVETHPKVFTGITVEHVLTGSECDAQKVCQAIATAAGRLSPVVVMTSKAAPIVHTYRLIDAASGREETGTVEVLAAG